MNVLVRSRTVGTQLFVGRMWNARIFNFWNDDDSGYSRLYPSTIASDNVCVTFWERQRTELPSDAKLYRFAYKREGWKINEYG
jgi:hypothetical protein